MSAAIVMGRWKRLAAAAVMLAVLAPDSISAASGPFDGLQGAWSGNGMLTYSNGSQERLACSAHYASPTPTDLTQAMRCASDSYNFQINANFTSANGRLNGNWSEVVNGLGGSVSGTVSGGKIAGDITSPRFTAQLSVVTKGNTQTVDILVPVQRISRVSIEMRKVSR